MNSKVRYACIVFLIATLYSFQGFGQCPSFSDSTFFEFEGNIVTYTVPDGVTNIRIVARGAQGGNNTNSLFPSGLGAEIRGTFAVSGGTQLKILVGQDPSGTGNGGGGGSFVTLLDNTPLIIAGGGGGSGDGNDSPEKHGKAIESGGMGSGDGGNGGIGGNGGTLGPNSAQSGAGGGLLTNGSDGFAVGSGGKAFINGGAGANVGLGVGGFGGGGNGSLVVIGGGGGGYSGGGSAGNNGGGLGGGGGGLGGGGGSFNAGSDPQAFAGVHSGNGQIVIYTCADQILIPTVGQWSIISLMLLILILAVSAIRYSLSYKKTIQY